MQISGNDYFLFENAGSVRCLCRDAPGNEWRSDDVSCGLNPGHSRRGRRLSELDVIVPCFPPADVLFAWTGCLPQTRVIDTLTTEGVTGMSTRDASAVLKKTHERISVAELLVVGWGGVLPQWTGVVLDEICHECHWRHYSDFAKPLDLINLTDWDGSDFFMIWPLSAYIFASRKVKDIFEKYKFSGVRFSRRFPYYPDVGVGFSPGGLSGRMSDERAHEIGDPLGIFM